LALPTAARILAIPATPEKNTMTLCPVAIAVGCKKCPMFAACPLKSVIGDQPPKDEKPAAKSAPSADKKKS
jgi:hypothetical protein